MLRAVCWSWRPTGSAAVRNVSRTARRAAAARPHPAASPATPASSARSVVSRPVRAAPAAGSPQPGPVVRPGVRPRLAALRPVPSSGPRSDRPERPRSACRPAPHGLAWPPVAVAAARVRVGTGRWSARSPWCSGSGCARPASRGRRRRSRPRQGPGTSAKLGRVPLESRSALQPDMTAEIPQVRWPGAEHRRRARLRQRRDSAPLRRRDDGAADLPRSWSRPGSGPRPEHEPRPATDAEPARSTSRRPRHGSRRCAPAAPAAPPAGGYGPHDTACRTVEAGPDGAGGSAGCDTADRRRGAPTGDR